MQISETIAIRSHSKCCARRAIRHASRIGFCVKNEAIAMENTVFATGKTALVYGNGAFPVTNATFPMRNATFALGNEALAIRNAVFSVENDAFILRNGAFLGRIEAFQACLCVFLRPGFGSPARCRHVKSLTIRMLQQWHNSQTEKRSLRH